MTLVVFDGFIMRANTLTVLSMLLIVWIAGSNKRFFNLPYPLKKVQCERINRYLSIPSISISHVSNFV